MSQTYSLICRETKQAVWLGQGSFDELKSLYNDKKTHDALKLFLIETFGKQLEFVCDDANDEVFQYENLDKNDD